MPHKRAKRSVREQKQSQHGKDLPPSQHALGNEAIPKGAARILQAAKIQQEWRERKRKYPADGAGDQSTGSTSKRRRRAADDGSTGGGSAAIKIQPGETLAHFNRRVEQSMQSLVRDAVKTSAAITRKVKQEEEAAVAASKAAKNKSKVASAGHPSKKASTDPGSKVAQAPEDDSITVPTATPAAHTKTHNGPKDFTALSTSTPRRLNDIVQAPPELNKFPRGIKAGQPTPAEGKKTKTTSLREGVLSMAQKAMLEEERERVVKAYRELKRRKAAG